MGVMNGKVVLVTGGGRGVGRGIALEFARAGAAVVVNDLGVTLAGEAAQTSPAQDVVREIAALGGRAIANSDSVASWDGAQAMVQAAIDAFGRIDAVVNNAGNLRDSLFHKMTEEEFDAVLAVHLKGSFNVSRAAAPSGAAHDENRRTVRPIAVRCDRGRIRADGDVHRGRHRGLRRFHRRPVEQHLF